MQTSIHKPSPVIHIVLSGLPNPRLENPTNVEGSASVERFPIGRTLRDQSKGKGRTTWTFHRLGIGNPRDPWQVNVDQWTR